MTVGVFYAFTGIYLFLNNTSDVTWEIYAFTLKDALISTLAIDRAVRSKDLVLHIASISLVSYLMTPFCIRMYCAFRSDFVYEAYRVMIENSSYRFLLTLILFTFTVMIYKSMKNE